MKKEKIIMFPFAGGNKYSFQKMSADFAYAVDYKRNEGQGFYDMTVLIDGLIKELEEKTKHTDEYIVYGHSMGALIGYLICHRLQELNMKLPQKLIVSGKKAPAVPRDKNISHLSDEEFWNEVIELGGIPDEMKNYPELIEYYLPILRHDFKLVEDYQYEKKEKLNIPIDVFFGSEEATEEDMAGWHDETTEKVAITQLDGNHFFIFDHVEYFKNYFDHLIKSKC